MKLIKTTICAATLMTASAAMTAEVSGNVALERTISLGA